METGDSTFFDLGSATLASSGTSVIAAIGQVIAPLNYDGRRFYVRRLNQI